MRTLSSTSRAVSVAAAIIAAVLVLGGAFFVGYVSELQRDLNDPASLRKQAAAHITAIERTLGYDGFLKAYRNFKLTGERTLRLQLSRDTLKAAREIRGLETVYAGNAAATDALREAAAIVETFAHIARTAPETGMAALRGTAAMDGLAVLPQSPQLESAYVSLRTALDRLRQAELDHQLGGAAWALNWSQMLIMAAIGCLAVALVIVAALLQLGIIQPLKSLERSLTSVGDGAISQKIWGVDRADEFGAIARAGEKVRRGLLETTALKTLAEKGQIHLSLDGKSSVLLERLAADMTSATETLKSASADLLRLQDTNSKQFDATARKLTESTAAIGDATNALRQGTSTAVEDMRASTAKLAETATMRVRQMDEIAARFDQGGQKFEETAAFTREKTATILEDMATTTGALKGLAGDTQAIQGAFFTACDKISSDAANTTENVRTLAARLSEAVGGVDERLSQKLNALDALESGLTETLGKLQARADETIAALNTATTTLDESNAAADARMKQNAADFEEVLRLFRDDEAALQQTSTRTMAELQAAQRTLADAAATQTQENRQLASAIARLNEIAAELQRPQPAPETAPAAELQTLADALRSQGDAIRSEIRDLAVRLTEDRLLATADMPFLGAKGSASEGQNGRRTLADVPGDEIMSRLKNLAAEMSAAQDQLDQVTSLKTALGTFASDVKKLAAGADRAARLKSMGKALDRHADEIEARAQAIGPSAETLRGELHGITSELRTIAARAQSNGSKEGPALREAAMDLGTRAETLFASLNEAQDASDDEPQIDLMRDEAADPTTASDLAALAQLIGRLEARAESLSQSAMSASLDDISDSLSPVEHEDKARKQGQTTDGAIHTVFESIERLNNIAAALARAGDAERQRRAAH